MIGARSSLPGLHARGHCHTLALDPGETYLFQGGSHRKTTGRGGGLSAIGRKRPKLKLTDFCYSKDSVFPFMNPEPKQLIRIAFRFQTR